MANTALFKITNSIRRPVTFNWPKPGGGFHKQTLQVEFCLEKIANDDDFARVMGQLSGSTGGDADTKTIVDSLQMNGEKGEQRMQAAREFVLGVYGIAGEDDNELPPDQARDLSLKTKLIGDAIFDEVMSLRIGEERKKRGAKPSPK